MSTKQDQLQTNQDIPGFTTAEFERVGQGEPVALRAKREEAYDIYNALPAPTAFTEDWRRTNPMLFPYGDFSLLAPLARLNKSPGGDASRDDQFDVVVSITEKGFYIDDRADLIKNGDLDVCGIAELAEKDPDTLTAYLQGDALSPHIGKFEALNDAFWNHTLPRAWRAGQRVPPDLPARTRRWWGKVVLWE